jgi:ABC-2 type transport system ATP-binding protein
MGVGDSAPGSSDAAILIRGARKVYADPPWRKRTAVEHVDLTVAAGSIHGLLGPNGAGKTTTIKMLVGLVRPDSGRFEILGRESRDPESRRPLGFLPEQPYFPLHLRASQAMRLYGRLAGVSGDRLSTDVEEKLRMVGLERHAEETLSKYSRGMLQRLGIAQALLGDPAVVVLDEPASGLDPVGQRDVRNVMLSLRERGTTVLLSSHQLSEVEVVCDRVSIVSGGRLAAEGHIDELLNVSGETSVSASGLQGGLPAPIEGRVRDVAVSGGVWVFSVDDEDVRAVVDAVDDAGGRIRSVAPKRQSLEDYFTRLLDESGVAS